MTTAVAGRRARAQRTATSRRAPLCRLRRDAAVGAHDRHLDAHLPSRRLVGGNRHRAGVDQRELGFTGRAQHAPEVLVAVRVSGFSQVNTTEPSAERRAPQRVRGRHGVRDGRRVGVLREVRRGGRGAGAGCRPRAGPSAPIADDRGHDHDARRRRDPPPRGARPRLLGYGRLGRRAAPVRRTRATDGRSARSGSDGRHAGASGSARRHPGPPALRPATAARR